MVPEGNHCSGLSKCHSEKCPVLMPFAHCGFCMKSERSLFSASSVHAARPPAVCLVGTSPLPIPFTHLPFSKVALWCALLGRRLLMFTSQITDPSLCPKTSTPLSFSPPPPCLPLSSCLCIYERERKKERGRERHCLSVFIIIV